MKYPLSAAAVAVAAALPIHVTAVAAQESIGETIVVTATRQPVKFDELLADVTVIERDEIERSAASNIVDLLARQPSIQFARNGGPGTSVSLFVRGTRADQTKVLVDGMPINSISLAGSPLQYLALNDVERIEIVRGAASAVYGSDAVGGVINVITRRGEPGLRGDGFVGYGSDDTRQVDAGFSGGNEQWRFRIHANSLTSNGFSARRDASNRDADDDGFRNEGGGASISLHPSQDHEIGASARQQRGVVHYDSFFADGNFDDRVKFRNTVATAHIRSRFSDSWTSTVSYGYAEEDRVDLNQPFPQIGFDGRTQMVTRNHQWTWQNDVRLPVGTGLVLLERFEQSAAPRANFSSANTTVDAVGIGWTASLDRHIWQINARYDDSSRFGGNATGGASYGFKLTPEWRASAGISKAFKAPSLDQLFNVAFGYGNPALRPERALNREISVSWEPGVHLASATYYVNEIKDLITFGTIGYENVERARIKGLLLTYGLSIQDWEVFVSADYLDAKNKTSGSSLGRRARESAKLTVLRRIDRLEIGGEIFAAGRRFDRNDETDRLGGYGVVNVSARYAMGHDWTIEGRLENALDKQYELAKGFNTQGRSLFVGVRYAPR